MGEGERGRALERSNASILPSAINFLNPKNFPNFVPLFLQKLVWSPLYSDSSLYQADVTKQEFSDA